MKDSINIKQCVLPFPLNINAIIYGGRASTSSHDTEYHPNVDIKTHQNKI